MYPHAALAFSEVSSITCQNSDTDEHDHELVDDSSDDDSSGDEAGFNPSPVKKKRKRQTKTGLSIVDCAANLCVPWACVLALLVYHMHDADWTKFQVNQTFEDYQEAKVATSRFARASRHTNTHSFTLSTDRNTIVVETESTPSNTRARTQTTTSRR